MVKHNDFLHFNLGGITTIQENTNHTRKKKKKKRLNP